MRPRRWFLCFLLLAWAVPSAAVQVTVFGPQKYTTKPGFPKAVKASFEMLLVATGRGPVTDGLDAEKVGLKMEKGYLVVDLQQ